MKIYLYLFFYIFLFSSCSKKSISTTITNENNSVVVSVETNPTGALSIYSIVDSVKFIPLENSNEALISRINNALFLDSLIFIHDKKTASVLVFNNQGKYKWKIDKKGGGTGEYARLTRLLIDEESRELMIYDSGQRKMIYYNEYGQFIKEITKFSEGAIFRDIINLPNGNFLCYRNDFIQNSRYSGVWETDSAGIFIKKILDVSDIYPHYKVDGAYFLYKLTNNRIGLMTSENNIYHYEKDTLVKILSFKLEGKNYLDFKGIPHTKEKYNMILSTKEKSNYILTEWLNEDNNSFITLYSHLDKKNIGFSAIDFRSKINGIYGKLLETNLPEVFLFSVSGETLQSILNERRAPDELVNQIKGLLPKISEEDIEDMNPILQIMYIKKDNINFEKLTGK